MSRLEQYTAYCEKHGMPDSICGFALWDAWLDEKDRADKAVKDYDDLVDRVLSGTPFAHIDDYLNTRKKYMEGQ